MTAIMAESGDSLTAGPARPRRLPWRLPRLSTTATCFGVATHFLIHGNRIDIEIPISPLGLLLSYYSSIYHLFVIPSLVLANLGLLAQLRLLWVCVDDSPAFSRRSTQLFYFSRFCTRARCFPTRLLVFVKKVCCLLSCWSRGLFFVVSLRLDLIVDAMNNR